MFAVFKVGGVGGIYDLPSTPHQKKTWLFIHSKCGVHLNHHILKREYDYSNNYDKWQRTQIWLWKKKKKIGKERAKMTQDMHTQRSRARCFAKKMSVDRFS